MSWLVRARLKRDVPASAIARLLVPDAPDARMGAGHRVIWALFADRPDRRRDFLWRETAPGAYLVLAARPPVDAHGLFTLESKRFAPTLRPGQRLGFDLRVNPAVSSRPAAGRARGQRHDAVMRALHAVPRGERAVARGEMLQEAAADWLTRQGERHGFTPDRLVADGYDQVRVPREGGCKPVAFSVLTVRGVLTVDDPPRFLSRLEAGFGAAKAFGCGLMLIRPAPAALVGLGEDDLQ